MKRILITGSAGFIGFSLSKRLLELDYEILGIDNYHDNYPVAFKKQNTQKLKRFPRFTFAKLDITDKTKIQEVFAKYSPDIVIHLAALTGVRNSLLFPQKYHQVNVIGTKNVYQLAIKNNCQKFIFASSSSVYGNEHTPFSESQALAPTSPYAWSKYKAEEMLKKLHQKSTLPTIVLRFFSVYGPHGRPDMAPYLFTEAALKSKSINKYGSGESARDYTYIDDIVEGIIKTLQYETSWDTINLGDSSPITLNQLINTVEKITGNKINAQVKPANKFESVITFANIDKAKKLLHWQPKFSFVKGIKKIVNWYKKERL
ncbi:NAD-dependent epimerase/dehydratase family protein [Candidatus Microgenomates bacterium]|nr:MAG: NAD-dependent epimerase/dehydratase family protein [Candidatus Microgenomates bacterium]